MISEFKEKLKQDFYFVRITEEEINTDEFDKPIVYKKPFNPYEEENHDK